MFSFKGKVDGNPLKLVILREGEAPRRLWLTGFDAPCLHTMYVDKPLQGHRMMQAIARVNRVLDSLASAARSGYSQPYALSVSHALTRSAQKQARRVDRGLRE